MKSEEGKIEDEKKSVAVEEERSLELTQGLIICKWQNRLKSLT